MGDDDLIPSAHADRPTVTRMPRAISLEDLVAEQSYSRKLLGRDEPTTAAHFQLGTYPSYCWSETKILWVTEVLREVHLEKLLWGSARHAECLQVPHAPCRLSAAHAMGVLKSEDEADRYDARLSARHYCHSTEHFRKCSSDAVYVPEVEYLICSYVVYSVLRRLRGDDRIPVSIPTARDFTKYCGSLVWGLVDRQRCHSLELVTY
jgi:hypothetical protein